MSLVYSNMQVSEVVEEYPSLIPVIYRFGIRLGVGDHSIQTLCGKLSLNTDFFLMMINTFLNEDYFPEKKLQGFHISQIVTYLKKTNHYYRLHQLPNIERHLHSFIQKSDPDNHSLVLLGSIFSSFKNELLARIQRDEEEWFPYCLSLHERGKSEQAFTVGEKSAEDADDPIEALLTDMKQIMIKHLSGEYDENLCHAVLIAVSTLGKDIKQHNRIRFRILQPIVTGMEQSGI